MTDTTTAGYLAPGEPEPLYDDALNDIFQGVISGITNLAGKLVRPRWQTEPPNQPAFGTDWVAFGVTTIPADWDAYQGHNPAADGGEGDNILERDEVIEVFHSFYGPNANSYAARYRDGLSIAQNRAALYALGIKLTEVKEAVKLPVLLMEKWVNRADVKVIYRRRIRRTYPVRTLVGGSILLDNEHYITAITITQ